MPEWYMAVATVVAFGGGIFALVNGYRTMRQSSPTEKLKKDIQKKWEKFYKHRWDAIIDRLEQSEQRVQKVEDIVKYVDSERTTRRFENIDEKLDYDNRRIRAMLDTAHSQQSFLKLLLEAQMQSLTHLSEGDHQGELKQVAQKIHEFLFHEATKVDNEAIKAVDLRAESRD